MSRWFKRPRNDHEAGSSSGARSGVPPPPAEAFGFGPGGVRIGGQPRVPAPPPASRVPPRAAPKGKRFRRYVRKEEAEWHWERATPVFWPDVHLPDGWHLNPQRIPVPPAPSSSEALREEIDRRRALLPAHLLRDRAYARSSPNWAVWLQQEHDQRRRSFIPTAQEVSTADYPAPPPGREPELWLLEDIADNILEDDDPELQAGLEEAYEASRRSLVEDEVKRWEQVLAAADGAAMPPPAAPAPWWQVMNADLEASEDQPPPQPLPPGLEYGMTWAWTGGVWSPEELPPPPPRQEALPPPPPHAPPMPPPPPAGPPQLHAHLWQAPPYHCISSDEEE